MRGLGLQGRNAASTFLSLWVCGIPLIYFGVPSPANRYAIRIVQWSPYVNQAPIRSFTTHYCNTERVKFHWNSAYW